MGNEIQTHDWPWPCETKYRVLFSLVDNQKGDRKFRPIITNPKPRTE